MLCLKAPAHIHVCLSWNGRFIFFYNFLFQFFCQKLAIFYKCKKKIKMQIIPTHSIWQQPSLIPTPHKFSAPFLAIQTNCTGRQWSQQVIKKKKWKKKKKNIPHPLFVCLFVYFSVINVGLLQMQWVKKTYMYCCLLSIWQSLHRANLKNVSEKHIFQNGTPCQSETCFRMAQVSEQHATCASIWPQWGIFPLMANSMRVFSLPNINKIFYVTPILEVVCVPIAFSSSRAQPEMELF